MTVLSFVTGGRDRRRVLGAALLCATVLAGCGEDSNEAADPARTTQSSDTTAVDATSARSASDPADVPADAGQAPEQIGDENIIRGDVVPISTLPWTAALVDASDADATLDNFCGGVLIGPTTVMTAAHCVTSRAPNPILPPTTPSEIEVVLGRTNLDESGGERIGVRRVEVSKRWVDSNRKFGDYALLILERPSTQKPIALPSPTSTALWVEGAQLVAAGWGCERVDAPDGAPCERSGGSPLKSAAMNVTAPSACDRAFGAIDRVTELCAQSAPAVQGTCNGDSGGPLIAKDGDTWYLVGLVSSGVIGCSPAVAEIEAFVPAVLEDGQGTWIATSELWYFAE